MNQEQPSGDSEADILQKLQGFFEPEQAAPAEPEPVAEASEQDVEGDEQPQEIQAVEAEEPGLVELEAEDGQTYKVPQVLKDGYLRQSDYTRKTQDIKNLATNAAIALQERDLNSRFEEWVAPDRQKLDDLKLEIKQYKKALTQVEDSNLGWRMQATIAQLEDQVKEADSALQSKRAQFDQHIERAKQQAAHSAAEFISRNVRGWSPNNEIDRAAGQFAASLGIPPEQMRDSILRFPGYGVMAAKAALYDKVVSAKGNAVQKAQKAPPVIKPGATTSTNSAAAMRTRDIAGRFKKTGDVNDFAKLLLAKGMVK